MTYVRIGGSSFSNEDIFAFVVVILVIGIASWIGYFILKSKDNSKPLEKAKVKILEKPVQKGNIEWYVVEFENGERKKLRSFHADTIFIAVGDEGILEYRGCIFRKNCASVPEERSAIPLQTEQSSAG